MTVVRLLRRIAVIAAGSALPVGTGARFFRVIRRRYGRLQNGLVTARIRAVRFVTSFA